MNEFAKAIFDEAGSDLARAVDLLNRRTCDQLLFGHGRFMETIAAHSRTLRDLVELDANRALGMAIDPAGMRRKPLHGREDLREFAKSMKA